MLNKKMLLMVGCLASGMVVASQKSSEVVPKQNLASAVVAKQFCDNPGKHSVEVLIQRSGYRIIAGNDLPRQCPCLGTMNAVMTQNPNGVPFLRNYEKPIHKVTLSEAGKLCVFLCNGEKHSLSMLTVEEYYAAKAK